MRVGAAGARAVPCSVRRSSVGGGVPPRVQRERTNNERSESDRRTDLSDSLLTFDRSDGRMAGPTLCPSGLSCRFRSVRLFRPTTDRPSRQTVGQICPVSPYVLRHRSCVRACVRDGGARARPRRRRKRMARDEQTTERKQVRAGVVRCLLVVTRA